MKRFEGLLLVSDFDGTLADAEGKIGERNTRALEYFTQNGGLFTVSTGRSKQGFHAFNANIMNAPVLLANGALLYDYGKQKTVFSESVNETHAELLENILKEFPFACMELYNAEHQSFLIHPTSESQRHLSRQGISYREMAFVSNAVFPLIKIMIHIGRENTRALQEYLRLADMGELCFIPSHGEFLEILPKKAGKGKSLLRLAQMYGIDQKKVFAAGDGSNDIDMLQTAAVSFVPANGDREALAAGTVTVCDHNNGAVADAVYYLEKHYSAELK